MYVIGIDGGGTKTKGIIANEKGEVVAEAVVGATNPNSVSKDQLLIEFDHLFQKLHVQHKEAFLQTKIVYAGMSGADHPTAREIIHHCITSKLSIPAQVFVTNDAITALFSGTLGEPGIVQIGGTGSVTYGLNEQGVRDRVGGWGYLLGEEGSGYSIGSAGLKAAFQDHDGFGEKTEMKQLILNHFSVDAMPDIVHTIYHADNTKELIASLSRIVVEAADNGDKVAINILEQNARYIGQSIKTLIKRLFANVYENQEVPVVFTGGIYNRFDLYQDTIKEVLLEAGINAKLILPTIEPVGGAVLAALKEAGAEIDRNFTSNFNN